HRADAIDGRRCRWHAVQRPRHTKAAGPDHFLVVDQRNGKGWKTLNPHLARDHALESLDDSRVVTPGGSRDNRLGARRLWHTGDGTRDREGAGEQRATG